MDTSINNNETDLLIQQQQQTTRIANKLLLNPNKKFYRYFSLIFICLLTLGPEGCYVLPGGIEKEIERDLKISTTEFTLFTSLYSWPNVIICFLSGYLIDSILGVRLGAIIFLTLITFGMFTFALGAYLNRTIVMHLGRFIFGLGGESIHVTQKSFAVKWFNENELNLVFGLLSSSALLGSSINQISMTPIYEYVNQFETGYKCLAYSILIGASICLLSLFSAFILFPLDKRRERYLNRIDASTTTTKSMVQITDAVHFPIELWFVILICSLFTSATFPFIGLGKLYFIRKFQLSSYMASLLQSLFFMITVVASPICGSLVDYFGFNLIWVIGALILGTLSHFLLMFTFMNVFIPVILLSVSFSIMCAALWPIVPMIIRRHQLATAYGLMQSGLNLGLAVFTLLSGYLVENNGYFILELFFVSLCSIGLVAASILYLIDRFKGIKIIIIILKKY
jgi:MFS family permease